MTTLVREEPLEHVAYLYDGTVEGLLSAVFVAYERHENPDDIATPHAFAPRLGQSVLEIPTDADRAQRVRRGVEKAGGKRSFIAVLRAAAHEDPDMGVIVLRFIRYVMGRPASVRSIPAIGEIGSPAVADIVRLEKRVMNECEKVRQFVRFSRGAGGVWFARIKPNAAVVPFIMGYFMGRMGGEPFIIYDEAHAMAGISDGASVQIARGVTPAEGMTAPSREDKLMTEAWKRFYEALSIDARFNPELRRHFMPVRLWDNLPELEPR